jgi:hypothetical protein
MWLGGGVWVGCLVTQKSFPQKTLTRFLSDPDLTPRSTLLEKILEISLLITMALGASYF